MKKRVKLTQKQYDELVEAREWCKRQDFRGFVQWYDEELTFQARRRALPDGAREYMVEDEERPRGRRDR